MPSSDVEFTHSGWNGSRACRYNVSQTFSPSTVTHKSSFVFQCIIDCKLVLSTSYDNKAHLFHLRLQATRNHDKLAAFRGFIGANMCVLRRKITSMPDWLTPTFRYILGFIPEGSPYPQAGCMCSISARNSSDSNVHTRFVPSFHWCIHQPRRYLGCWEYMDIYPSDAWSEYVHYNFLNESICWIVSHVPH